MLTKKFPTKLKREVKLHFSKRPRSKKIRMGRWVHLCSWICFDDNYLSYEFFWWIQSL